jgi:beta-mannosidase
LESTYVNKFEGWLQFAIYDKIIFMDKLTFSHALDGSVRVDLQIPINESLVIHAWYPNGIGSQMLYKLKVSLMTPQESFNKTLKIGFRTIELIQDNIKPNGLTFYFKVNGIPFFAKGSNWIPAQVFPELLTKDYIRYLLQSTKDANMNMLRVWGGGVYETNDFYEIADELGIMIWHDFMFACALYPTNDEFLASVETEVLQQVRRLQHHPSIALWAGILSYLIFC